MFATQPTEITIAGAQTIDLAQIVGCGHAVGLDYRGFEMFIGRFAVDPLIMNQMVAGRKDAEIGLLEPRSLITGYLWGTRPPKVGQILRHTRRARGN